MKEFVVHHVIDSDKELDSLKEFLHSNNLPAEDVSLNKGLFLVYYNTHDVLVGSGGLEFYNNLALLRSLAVSPELRGQQVGKEIVSQLLEAAKQRGISEVRYQECGYLRRSAQLSCCRWRAGRRPDECSRPGPEWGGKGSQQEFPSPDTIMQRQ
jgi:GNAT superfamily N-acetyltransferase